MIPQRQRIFVRICATALCIWGVAIVAWSIRFKQSSVDLLSGRERDRFSICGICFREQVRDTPFSKILQRGRSADPEWRVAFETGPFQRVSPHFTHHSTPTTLKKTVLIGELLEAPAEVRRKKCEQVLERLRNGDRAGARKLLDEWWNEGRGELDVIEAGGATFMRKVETFGKPSFKKRRRLIVCRSSLPGLGRRAVVGST